jgi:hypothetical protein
MHNLLDVVGRHLFALGRIEKLGDGKLGGAYGVYDVDVQELVAVAVDWVLGLGTARWVPEVGPCGFEDACR